MPRLVAGSRTSKANIDVVRDCGVRFFQDLFKSPWMKNEISEEKDAPSGEPTEVV